MGVFVESVRHIFAKRQPDARLLTAYVNPCASAYLWTMLTALFQVFLRSNESLSKAKSCVKLRADITDVYLAICFEIMRERNKEDYGNETRHAVGQKAPQVADELLWKMTQHKGKSLGDNDVKAQAVLESLDEILGFLLQNDEALARRRRRCNGTGHLCQGGAAGQEQSRHDYRTVHRAATSRGRARGRVLGFAFLFACARTDIRARSPSVCLA